MNPSKTTQKKVRHSEFRLFNELPAPKQLIFDPVPTTYATCKEKLSRALELVFKLLDRRRKGSLYSLNLDSGQLHPSVQFVLAPILAHAQHLDAR